MKESNKRKKKGIIIAGISAIVLIVTLGVSFAFWNYSRTTDNQVLVAGDIFMKYTETNQLVIKDALPSKEPGENDYFEFKITGKNTYNKPIWYEIVLNHGVENPEGRTERLLDKFLMFRLVEIKGEEEQTVVDNASYEDITSQKIWVNTIPAGTKDNIEITYKLYMWISYDTKIGNTDGNDYDMETWNDKVYASVKVSVNGDFEEKKLDGSILKDKITEKVTDDNSVTDDDTGIIYLSGTNEEINFNYVKYSAMIWRVTAIYPDGRLKMMTENCIKYVNRTYWGKDEIKNALYNFQDISEDEIDLINNFEYGKAYEKATKDNNFLNTGYEWVTSDYSGSYGYDHASGIRPSIILKSDIVISNGEGTKNNPYELQMDKEPGKINDKINSRLSGEYVKLNDMVYRIVKIEDNNSTKLISIDYVRDGGIVKEMDFSFYFTSSPTCYGSSNSENFWDYYLNNTWVLPIKNYLTEGNYDTDIVYSQDYSPYEPIRCETWTGYVGFPTYGEMFTTPLEELEDTGEEFLVMAYVTQSNYYGNGYDYSSAVIDKTYGLFTVGANGYGAVRPSIHLKPEIIITGGKGTFEEPYEIGLPS